MVFSLTPGDTLRNVFSSKSASSKGSFNYSGVTDPVVDALIELAITATDRSSLNVACRALDRVLRAGHYWVPGWYKPSHWIAYWDIFGQPAIKPRYARGIPETWWYDARKGGQDRTIGLGSPASADAALAERAANPGGLADDLARKSSRSKGGARRRAGFVRRAMSRTAMGPAPHLTRTQRSARLSQKTEARLGPGQLD